MLSGIHCYGSSSETDSTYLIKTRDFDQLIFMARKGKMLDSVTNASLAALQALRATISENARTISLQGEQLQNYRILTEALKATISNDREQGILERSKLKAKLKKRGRIIALETGVIVVLVLLL
ncbi:MAG: hypothetical protein BWY15_02106 [Firmicutes bacterium ADurb.Bin193]|nr:MAG: hypothetical protein BWY15_02106 [Firmicutes bacterium ADurb.Bin193]